MIRRAPTLERDLTELQEVAESDIAALDGKRVLVTGGAGFLLAPFVEALVERARANRGRGPEVVVADNFVTGARGRLAAVHGDPAFRLVDADVRDADSVRDLGSDYDVVVHGASIASPPAYRARPVETIEVNVLGTMHLLRGLDPRRGTRFVLVSTSEVYGDPDPSAVPLREDYEGRVSCTGPRACYDESKRLAETYALAHHRARSVPVRIVRPFNVYGPGFPLDDGRVLPCLVRDALAGSDLVLHSDGTPRRAFCYVTDFLSGFLRVVVAGADGQPYNVGNDQEEVSMRELAERLARVHGGGLRVRIAASGDADYLRDNPQRRSPDLTRLRALGVATPRVPLDAGLARYLAWAREVS